MDLIRYETILEFLKESRVTTPAQSVFKALSNRDAPETGRPREPGVRIRDDKDKVEVVWDYDSCKIVHEDMASYDDCIQKTIILLHKIKSVVPIPKLSSRRVIMYWILATKKYDFKSLELKYRENFIKESTIFDNCFDSSIVIDMKRDKYILHHQSGAMDVAQLQALYKTFKIKEGHPKLFLFLETTITSKEVVEYSSEGMKDFLLSSYQIGKSHSDAFQNTMEELL